MRWLIIEKHMIMKIEIQRHFGFIIPLATKPTKYGDDYYSPKNNNYGISTMIVQCDHKGIIQHMFVGLLRLVHNS
jgi:hypothetical protein